jgi:hypothetical protein
VESPVHGRKILHDPCSSRLSQKEHIIEPEGDAGVFEENSDHPTFWA